MLFHTFMVQITKAEKSFLKKFIPLAAFIGGLCCFTPLILVMLGLSSLSFAASLSNTLYDEFRWVFRGMAFLFLLAALGYYLYREEDVCTLDDVKRKRRKIINLVLLSVSLAIIAYIVWLYVIVGIIGIVAGIW